MYEFQVRTFKISILKKRVIILQTVPVTMLIEIIWLKTHATAWQPCLDSNSFTDCFSRSVLVAGMLIEQFKELISVQSHVNSWTGSHTSLHFWNIPL